MKKKNKLRWGSSLIATTVMIIVVAVVSYSVIVWINHREEGSSMERLYEEADRLVKTIDSNMKSDREKLELIAAVIAQFEDIHSERLCTLLDSYDVIGMMSRIEVLLPDDTVLTKGGKTVDVGGVLSFEKEAAQGAHITDRETDLEEDGSYIVRHYVPVVRDGETVAMLYGVIELGNLPEKMLESSYSGENAALYVIDGNTGDFLVDTWHPGETGNIWGLGEREMAPGYNHEQLKSGLINGENNFVVFISESVGEYLYFYYQPIEINQWRLALSVPESVVFEDANAVRNVLNLILVFEAVCFVSYFLWMFRYVRNETREKQHELERVNYIYDVENLLFNAHEKQENVTVALGKVADLLSAERVGFWLVGKSRGDVSFLWKRDSAAKEQKIAVQKENVYSLLEYFGQGNSEFEAYNTEELKKKLPDNDHNTIYNVVAVPVEDLDGKISGILVSCNMPERKADVTLLKSVKFSFGMFCFNLKRFYGMKEQGEMDLLTGLYNRNRYEEDLSKIQTFYTKSLTCLYIDVNGLHELNNAKGHEAGDRMLKAVADQIRETFKTEYTYRIGGDEFVVFVPDREEDDVKDLCGRILETLKANGYYISIGYKWQPDVPSVTDLIKSAEKKMYEEKKKYYEQDVRGERKTRRI